MGCAEVAQQAAAASAQLRFQRSRCVVDAGVNDAAVVGGLVSADRAFLVNDGHGSVRMSALDLPGGGQANDAGPDDGKAVGGQVTTLLGSSSRGGA